MVVLMTTPAGFDAEHLATTLVEESLVKCVNIVPGIRSVYVWEGEVCVDDERLCVLKLPRENVEALRQRAVALHPADVPEFLVVDVAGGHQAYLDWIVAGRRLPVATEF